jgi:secondary thiamine-phosphate synthase enzyme
VVEQRQFTFRTTGHHHMHDLTECVQEFVGKTGVAVGLVHLFAVGSTAALGVIEFEPGLQKDLPELLDRLMPPSPGYAHEQTWHDGNGHSHLQATLLGPSLAVPISGGRLNLGTWQQVFHIECDTRPRERTVVATIIG